MNIRNVFFCSAVLLIASLPMLAQGTYTQIDYPSATLTVACGINSAGDVVGYWQDGSSNIHGFLLQDGVFTSIDDPISSITEARGINDQGQIVGWAGSEGFLYEIQAHTFTPIQYSIDSSTQALGINNSGTIVGTIQTSDSAFGFELNNSTYKLLTAPNAAGTFIFGINNLGDALIYGYGDITVWEYFLLTNDEWKKLYKYPALLEPRGINDTGSMVGVYFRNKKHPHAFVQNGSLRQILLFPDAAATVANGINNDGVVTGNFITRGDLASHGFIWTPRADPVKK